MVRAHLLWSAAGALFSLGAQPASFAPSASFGPPTTASVTASVAAAQTGTAPPTRTLWLCSLSERLTQLVCVADTDPAEAGDGGGSAAGGPDETPVTAVVRGTRFPLDPQRLWVVDLWTPPSAADDVALLARATICYRSPGCEVRLNLPALGSGPGQRLTQRWRSR